MYFDLKRKKNYTWMSSLIELACHMCKISHLAPSPELRSPARTKIKQGSYREEFFASLLRRGTKIKRAHKHRDLLHCYPNKEKLEKFCYVHYIYVIGLTGEMVLTHAQQFGKSPCRS